jgi:hypothetical protein
VNEKKRYCALRMRQRQPCRRSMAPSSSNGRSIVDGLYFQWSRFKSAANLMHFWNDGSIELRG